MKKKIIYRESALQKNYLLKRKNNNNNKNVKK